MFPLSVGTILVGEHTGKLCTGSCGARINDHDRRLLLLALQNERPIPFQQHGLVLCKSIVR